MKKTASLITYVAALVVGILLLALHGQEGIQLLQCVVIAMGILIIIPSALMLINSFIGKKDANGNRTYSAWYTVVVAIAGLVLGIWMLCMPGFFEAAMVYTLGVILILIGVAQIIFVKLAARPLGANVWWYAIPVLVVAGGFIICFIGPREVNTWATLTTGIVLIVYAVNGLASFGRECKGERELKAEEKALEATREETFTEE